MKRVRRRRAAKLSSRTVEVIDGLDVSEASSLLRGASVQRTCDTRCFSTVLPRVVNLAKQGVAAMSEALVGPIVRT